MTIRKTMIDLLSIRHGCVLHLGNMPIYDLKRVGMAKFEVHAFIRWRNPISYQILTDITQLIFISDLKNKIIIFTIKRCFKTTKIIYTDQGIKL